MAYKPDYLITPYQLIVDENLTPTDERIYSIVYYYKRMKQDKCIASNKSVADLAKVSPGTVKNSLTKLEKRGYIKRIYETEKRRKRKEIIPLICFSMVSSESDTPRHHTMTPPSSDNDHINKSNINKSNNYSDVVDFFFQKKGWKEQPEPVKSRYKKPAKELLEMASLEEIKKKINIVSTWAESRDLNWTLSTVIKKWGEIDSLKEKKEKKKPYFRGEPMTKKNDQWYVMPKDGGQWQEFAGSKDDIEWK